MLPAWSAAGALLLFVSECSPREKHVTSAPLLCPGSSKPSATDGVGEGWELPCRALTVLHEVGTVCSPQPSLLPVLLFYFRPNFLLIRITSPTFGPITALQKLCPFLSPFALNSGCDHRALISLLGLRKQIPQPCLIRPASGESCCCNLLLLHSMRMLWEAIAASLGADAAEPPPQLCSAAHGDFSLPPHHLASLRLTPTQSFFWVCFA